MKEVRGRPFPAALAEAGIAAALVWFFAAVVFERPERAFEMAVIGGGAVFVVELVRRMTRGSDRPS